MIQYEIPQELSDMQAEAFSLRQMRDIYTMLPIGGFRRAVKLNTRAAKIEFQFWYKIFKLYPDLHEAKRQGKKIKCDPQDRIVEVVD